MALVPWDQTPEFLATSDWTIAPGGPTQYNPPRRVGYAGPQDVTSFHPGQANWSEQNMPNILYVFRPPPNWITFKQNEAITRKLPPPKRDVHGNIMYEQWPRNPNNPEPLLDFKHLPDRVGTQEFWWVYEAWRRYDPRIRWKDIWMRQEGSDRSLNVDGNGIQMLVSRNRASHRMITWKTDDEPSSGTDWTEQMTDQQRRDNTTRGLTPGLINPALGEAGGRIPLPNLIKGAGQQKRKAGPRKQNKPMKDQRAAKKTRARPRKRQKTRPGTDVGPSQVPSTAPFDPYRSQYLAPPPAPMVPPISPYQLGPNVDPAVQIPPSPYAQSYHAPDSSMQAQGPAYPSNLGSFPGTFGDYRRTLTQVPQNLYRGHGSHFGSGEQTVPLDVQQETQPWQPLSHWSENLGHNNPPDAVAGMNEPLSQQGQSQQISWYPGYYVSQYGSTQSPDVGYPPQGAGNQGFNPRSPSYDPNWQTDYPPQRQPSNVPISPYTYGYGARYPSRPQPHTGSSLPSHGSGPVRGTMIDPDHPESIWQPSRLGQRQSYNVPANTRASARTWHPSQSQPPWDPPTSYYTHDPNLPHTQWPSQPQSTMYPPGLDPQQTYYPRQPSRSQFSIYDPSPAPGVNTAMDPYATWDWTQRPQQPPQVQYPSMQQSSQYQRPQRLQQGYQPPPPGLQATTTQPRQPSNHRVIRPLPNIQPRPPPHAPQYQPAQPDDQREWLEYGLPPSPPPPPPQNQRGLCEDQDREGRCRRGFQVSHMGNRDEREIRGSIVTDLECVVGVAKVISEGMDEDSKGSDEDFSSASRSVFPLQADKAAEPPQHSFTETSVEELARRPLRRGPIEAQNIMENPRDSATALEPSTTGISILANPESPKIDVVFVHGFKGHPVRTWSHKSETVTKDQANQSTDDNGRPAKVPRLMSAMSRHPKARDREKVYWPKHLLPELLPSARILTYGYDTNVRHAFGPPVSKNTVYDIAWDFLVTLDAERRSYPSRPLVFVAHSLGGIVVKELLRRAAGCIDHQIRLHQIYKSTAAIMFFGTPHWGADPRGFFQHIAEQVVRASGLTVNEQVVNTLLPSSERLRELRDEFGLMVRRQSWVVYCFQEEYGVPLLSGKKVVEDVSSCLGDPSLETTQHIASNHMDMCRFGAVSDLEYRKVVAAFQLIEVRIRETREDGIQQEGTSHHDLLHHNVQVLPAAGMIVDKTQSKAFLDALSFPALDARYSTIRTAHAKTCKWILHRIEYRDWFDVSQLDRHHGIFWIKGKPGCGKSTLLKFVVQNARRTKKEAEVISFFFNARGEELERSTLGMYRSLLLQLLRAFPDLQMLIDCARFTNFQDGESYDWTIIELQTMFIDAFRNLGQRQLICFIDALDECKESQIRDLITFLEELGEIVISSQLRFHACLSSRHYPHISIKHGIELTLEGQEGHDQDIAKYLDSELKAGKGKQCEAIKNEICSRASGVFLWVALVVQILNKEYDHGRVHALRRRLKEIPDGLDKLFEDILTRDQESMDELILCLQWILYATRPLKRDELYYAILSGTDAEALNSDTPGAISVEDMERFILSCSKGLAETTKTKEQNVQFIHESVRDFLLGKNGFNKLKSDLEPGRSHERLKQCCCVYMKVDMSGYIPASMDLPVLSFEEAKDLRAQITERFPFLQYATQQVLFHADRAELEGVSQANFTENFVIRDWIKLHNLLERYQIRRFDSSATFFFVSVKKTLNNLVRTPLDNISWGKSVAESFRLERYDNPLCIIFSEIEISTDTLRAILNPIFRRANKYEVRSIQYGHEKDYQQAAIETIIQNRTKLYPRSRKTFLDWVTLPEQEAVIFCLLANGDVDPNLRNSEEQSLLFIAAAQGQLAIVSLLLSHSDVMYGDKDIHCETALYGAAENGHEAVVSLLLSNGVDPSAKDILGQTPLFRAAENGHEAIVSLLLSTGVNPDAKDDTDRTPLSLAVRSGHIAVVSLLLSRDVDAKVLDKHGYTPLSYAATSGHTEIIQLLLTVKNIDVNSPTTNGLNPQLVASARRHWYTAALLSLHHKGVWNPASSNLEKQEQLFDEAIAINEICSHREHDPHPISRAWVNSHPFRPGLRHTREECVTDAQRLKSVRKSLTRNLQVEKTNTTGRKPRTRPFELWPLGDLNPGFRSNFDNLSSSR
ncbi:MAG: hypothetical protein Q9216_002491 [Gyalolechia sp. 2 TL-2023]